MRFRPGDKVKFLSEKGGGTITRIISDKLVGVEIEEGFEIPTAIHDLIPVREEGESNPSSASRRTAPPEAFEAKENQDEQLLRLSALPQTGQGVFMAFEPHDQTLLIHGKIDLWLVNRTAFEFIYSLFLKNSSGGYTGKDYGSIGPGKKHCIETIDREHIEAWCKGLVQGVFHADNPPAVLDPLNASFSIKPLRFLKEDNYRHYDFTTGRVFLFSLAPLSELRSDNLPAEPSKAEPVRPEAFIDKHKADDTSAVVDLHIETLTNTHARLLPAEMLNIQLSYFNRALQSALSESLTQVVFIHGVGQGILKSEIRKALDAYDFIHYYDAPLAEYGTGATIARIYRS